MPDFIETDTSLEFMTRNIPTISMPDTDLPLGSIGFGHADLPELGRSVLIYVRDGSGSGAVAVLTEEHLLPVLYALQTMSVQSGLISVPTPPLVN